VEPTHAPKCAAYGWGTRQKPLKLLNRIVQVHSDVGDTVLDFFAGSGTTGVAAARAGRKFILMDSSADAVKVMTERLAFAAPRTYGLEGGVLLGPSPRNMDE
jgi:site-specific DNA-methyltransferase (adenine-specific)